MENNSKIIRKAAIELHGLDHTDVVKVAGVVKKVVNWIKGFGDPDFQRKLEELQSMSPAIKGTVDALSVEIDKLNKALSNTDPEQFGKSLEQVRPLISDLAGSLSALDQKASEAEAEAPLDAVVNEKGQVISGEDVKRLEQGWKQDPELVSKMKSMLPDGLDVPVKSHINKPLMDFEWFQQFGTDNIRFSEYAKQLAVDKIASLIFDIEDIPANVQSNIIGFLNRNKEYIVNQLRENILNGILRSYNMPSTGQPNKMTVVVDAGTINVPGIDFEVQFPTVFMQDKFTTFTPVKELDVYNLKNVRPYNAPKNIKIELDEGLIRDVIKKNDWNIAASARELGISDRSLRRKMQEFGIVREEEPVVQEPDPVDAPGPDAASEALPPAEPAEAPADEEEDVDEIEFAEPEFIDRQEAIASRLDVFEKLGTGSIHEWARGVIQAAFPKVMGRAPTESEIQAVQAIAHLESSYGRGWKGKAKGSNNWGAIQCGSCKKNGRCDPNTSFEHRDSTPQPDGTNKWYVTCFKKYPTPEEGAADLIKTLFRSKRKAVKGSDKEMTRGELLSDAAARGDLRGFSEAMYDTVYYEGTGKDKATRVQRHMGAMQRALESMTKGTGREIAMIDGGNNQAPGLGSTDIIDGGDARELFNFLYASGPIEKMVRRAIYKKALPTTRVLITIGSSDLPFHTRVRFAKILSSALRTELDAESSIHNYDDKIEIESDISGSQSAVVKAAKGLSDGISDAFELSTDKCGGYKISTRVFANVKSAYALIDSGTMETSFRKFAFEMVSK